MIIDKDPNSYHEDEIKPINDKIKLNPDEKV